MTACINQAEISSTRWQSAAGTFSVDWKNSLNVSNRIGIRPMCHQRVSAFSRELRHEPKSPFKHIQKKKDLCSVAEQLALWERTFVGCVAPSTAPESFIQSQSHSLNLAAEHGRLNSSPLHSSSGSQIRSTSFSQRTDWALLVMYKKHIQPGWRGWEEASTRFVYLYLRPCSQAAKRTAPYCMHVVWNVTEAKTRKGQMAAWQQCILKHCLIHHNTIQFWRFQYAQKGIQAILSKPDS